MNENESEKTRYQKQYQKCKSDIGGEPYYVIQLDCIYDGKALTACEKVVVCAECSSNLKSWLNLPQ